jgi:hypothetical protein
MRRGFLAILAVVACAKSDTVPAADTATPASAPAPVDSATLDSLRRADSAAAKPLPDPKPPTTGPKRPAPDTKPSSPRP